MAHPFVLAQFNPTLTATKARMKLGVVQAASSITCCPFLALTIALPESHAGRPAGYNLVLFPVSPEKPSGEFAEYYVTVSLPPTKQTKVLHLALPSQSDVLYIHTVPALYLKSDLPSNTLPYQLDPETLEQLRVLGKEQLRSWLNAEIQHRNSGGKESVQANWDTWSSENETLYEFRGHFGPLVFEFLNPDRGFDLGTIRPPRVVEELMIFKKCVVSLCLPYPLTMNVD